MRTLVESLKRLYTKGQVKREKIEEMTASGKITEEEKNYIISEKNI